MKTDIRNLHSSGRIAKNFLWNVLGTGAPQLTALIAIPILVEGLGTARFGMLTIAWMVVGYFSLFDLGLGRALTKVVAEKLGRSEHEQIPSLVWSAMTLMAALGVLGGLIIASLTPWISESGIKASTELRQEAQSVFYLLAVSVPIVICSIGLRGILEANQRFDVVNIIRLPLGIFTFVGPVAVLPFSTSLLCVVLTLVVGRVIGFFAYLYACLTMYPELRALRTPDSSVAKRLLSYGGWMTVSNITAPLLLYLGRIFIVVMISAEAVAYFVTPYEVVINLLVIPGMLISVLFPAFASLFQGNKESAIKLYRQGIIAIFVVMFPLASIAYAFARPGLALWINEEFATNGYMVLQYLAIGVFINSFGHLAQALIQSYGRPDLTAKLHLVELLLYVPYLWFLIDHSGIVGAAMAWTIRVTISTVVLSYMSMRCLNGTIQSRY